MFNVLIGPELLFFLLLFLDWHFIVIKQWHVRTERVQFEWWDMGAIQVLHISVSLVCMKVMLVEVFEGGESALGLEIKVVGWVYSMEVGCLVGVKEGLVVVGVRLEGGRGQGWHLKMERLFAFEGAVGVLRYHMFVVKKQVE